MCFLVLSCLVLSCLVLSCSSTTQRLIAGTRRRCAVSLKTAQKQHKKAQERNQAALFCVAVSSCMRGFLLMITFAKPGSGQTLQGKLSPASNSILRVFASGKEWRLALLQSCPPLRRLLDEEGGSLNFPPYLADRIGAVWLKHWQKTTGMPRKRSFCPLFALKMHHFTKTGLGQT